MEPEIYQRMREIEDRHWWFVGRRRILEAMLGELSLPRPARVLEAGCGTGGNLQMLARFGHVRGMEMSASARALARARGVAEVESGRLPDDIPFGPEPLDLIALFDVLEHLDDDVAALRSLSARLAPGGRIVLTVPAFAFLWSRQDDLNHHKRRYDAASLNRAIAAAGLIVEHLTYFNTWLFPVVVAATWMQRLLPVRTTGGVLTLPPALVNRLLLGLFASERHIVTRHRLPVGISLLAVISRSARS